MIWNNGSTDGTREYLDSLTEPRLRIVHNAENIGQNAYAEAFRRRPRRTWSSWTTT